MKRIFTAILLIAFIAAVAYANTISEQPNGWAFPKWYSYSDGAKSTYYLEHPTLSANDQVVAEDATQTLTNKTLTSPTITSPTTFVNTGEEVTAANVITAAEAGKTFFLNSATEFASTLPTAASVTAGTRYRFVVTAAPSGASYTITTGNSLENKIYGLVVVNGATVAAADEDTITFADGSALVGDWVEVIGDGSNWYVSGQGANASSITLTPAD